MTIQALAEKTSAFISAQYALKGIPPAQLRMEASLTRELNRLFKNAMDTLVRQVREGGIPADRTVLISKMQTIQAQVCDIVFGRVKSAGRQGIKTGVRDLTRAGLPAKELTLSSVAVDAMRQRVLIASADTMKRMMGKVEQTLAEVVKQGLTYDQAAKVIEKDFINMRTYELRRLARTEIHGAMSSLRHDTIRDAGVFEQWITCEDADVRDSHVELHGQITRAGDPFSNGLRYPGDSSGDPAEFINCRCSSVPFIMPPDKMAPAGMSYFYESDLVDRPKAELKVLKGGKA